MTPAIEVRADETEAWIVFTPFEDQKVSEFVRTHIGLNGTDLKQIIAEFELKGGRLHSAILGRERLNSLPPKERERVWPYAFRYDRAKKMVFPDTYLP